MIPSLWLWVEHQRRMAQQNNDPLPPPDGGEWWDAIKILGRGLLITIVVMGILVLVF